MKIFFDTEFTGLGSDPRLLSIGMVTESGLELYFEFTDGWSEEKCSPWVRINVLPLMGSAEKLNRRAGARRIIAWLSSLAKPTSFLGDSDWDTELLRQLLEESQIDQSEYRLELLKFESQEQARLFDSAKKQYFAHESVQPHHALTDAKAFMAAYKVAFNSDALGFFP